MTMVSDATLAELRHRTARASKRRINLLNFLATPCRSRFRDELRLVPDAVFGSGVPSGSHDSWTARLHRIVAPSGIAPQARAALWIFLAFTFLYIGITRGHFVGTDEIAVYQTTRSLWEEGNLSTSPVNNTFVGRGGRYYAVYNAGQSIAALPLYGLGKILGRNLAEGGRDDWIETLAGPVIGENKEWRWGGEIEIFFVNLLNCFITGLLCALFYAFNLRLGAASRWSLASTALLGLTSFVAPFATGFLQHSSEALFLLWALYFLHSDAERPSRGSRAWAGVLAALMLVFRFPAVVALPGLSLYLLWNLWQRRPPGTNARNFPMRAFWQALPFAAPVAAGVALHMGINAIKFGTVSLAGKYGEASFSTPLLEGLYGLLLSPGESLFLFTPLLVLAPWTCRHLMRRHRGETLLLLLLAASYLVFYGSFEFWHGLWSSLGPRYLVPIVPLLLLPLAGWMEHAGRRSWLAVAPLAAAGLWVQLLHVAVNFSYVSYFEHYQEFQPPYGFLFIPDASPLAAHWKALQAGDYRVDMWLIHVYRRFGAGRVLALSLPLATLLAFCLQRLRRSSAAEPQAHPIEIRFSFGARYGAALAALLCVGTGLAMLADRPRAQSTQAVLEPEIQAGLDEDALMQAGLDELYGRANPKRAVQLFRGVLEKHPGHYGATFQLAKALDQAGRPGEARPVWERMLEMAERSSDAETASMVRARLAKGP
ncbi:MAG: glycosyltransferase family 39 protein [Acidobacteria bacterium]|nr:glycosyltransferase family 39 protein [Acidobacteriota bacterium]